MRVLVLGATGMLGHKVCQRFADEFDVYATVRHPSVELDCLVQPDHVLPNVDANWFGRIASAVTDVGPDVVVNCIGIIKQLPDSNNAMTAIAINALFPHRLAELCQKYRARLIHVSTDCVFSGRNGHYVESDVSDAEDLYGRTKYLGELSREGCLTLRTSIIGRELHTSNGLLEWFLSNRGGRVRGYARAMFSGLTTLALADALASIIEGSPDLSGVYHLASRPISKYHLLQQINALYGSHTQIDLDNTFACDRSLDGSLLESITGIVAPPWPTMLYDLFTDPTPYDAWRTQ